MNTHPSCIPQYPSDIPVYNIHVFLSPLYKIVNTVIFLTLLTLKFLKKRLFKDFFHASIFICWTLHSKWALSTVQLSKSFVWFFFQIWMHTEYTTCKYWHFWWSASSLKICFFIKKKKPASIYLVQNVIACGKVLILCFVLEKNPKWNEIMVIENQMK